MIFCPVSYQSDKVLVSSSRCSVTAGAELHKQLGNERYFLQRH